MSTIRATYIQHGSSAVPNITLNASGDVVIASGITVTGSITASGFVSSSSVVIPSGSAAAPGIYFAGDTDTGLFTASGNTIAVTTSGTERLRVDDGGKVLVGTSSASGSALFQVQGRSGATTDYAAFSLRRGSLPSATDQGLGVISFTDNSDNVGAQISALSDAGSWTSGSNHRSRLVFSTTADGDPSPTERMRIDSSGRLLVGTSTAGAGAGFTTNVAFSGYDTFISKTAGVAANSAVPARFWHDAASGDNLLVNFATDATYTSRAFIDYNRSAGQVRYNVTSDQRLKSNIQDSESALNVLNQIKVRSYIWTETGYSIPHGFIAQELNEAVPDAVRAGDDGDEVVDIWAVDNAKLVPLLTKALQEAMTEIESLKSRVTALEP